MREGLFFQRLHTGVVCMGSPSTRASPAAGWSPLVCNEQYAQTAHEVKEHSGIVESCVGRLGYTRHRYESVLRYSSFLFRKVTVMKRPALVPAYVETDKRHAANLVMTTCISFRNLIAIPQHPDTIKRKERVQLRTSAYMHASADHLVEDRVLVKHPQLRVRLLRRRSPLRPQSQTQRPSV